MGFFLSWFQNNNCFIEKITPDFHQICLQSISIPLGLGSVLHITHWLHFYNNHMAQRHSWSYKTKDLL